MKAPVDRAAAMAVTFQAVQLMTYGSLGSRIALQIFQDMSQAIHLASDSTVGWHLLALAEILRHCEQDHIEVCEPITMYRYDLSSAQHVPTHQSSSCGIHVNLTLMCMASALSEATYHCVSIRYCRLAILDCNCQCLLQGCCHCKTS